MQILAGTGLANRRRIPQQAEVANSLWTHDFLDRAVGVRSLSGFLDGSAQPSAATQIALITQEKLTAQQLLGKRIFYHASDPRMSAEGYISCASCHRDGGHDGRTWDFTGRGEGLRNTIALQGRSGLGHGRVHWTANFDEIQDFEHDIRGPFGGSGFLSDADFAASNTPLGPSKAGKSAELDALAAYVTSLDMSQVPRSPQRNESGVLTDAAAAGQSLFVSQGCITCHLPEQGLRDGVRHDVGTAQRSDSAALAGIDTPTLLGLAHTAPYLHDGSARTLSDVFQLAAGTSSEAEAASSTSGSLVTDTSDTFWSGTGYVELNVNQELLLSELFSTTSAGDALLSVRYSTDGGDGHLDVLCDGQTAHLHLPGPSSNAWQQRSEWALARISLPVRAGTHTLRLISREAVHLAIDRIEIASPDDLARAFVHRRVLSLSAGEQATLETYLFSLDRLTQRVLRFQALPKTQFVLPDDSPGLFNNDGSSRFPGLDPQRDQSVLLRASGNG